MLKTFRSIFLLLAVSIVCFAQSDVLRIVGGTLEEGQSAQFPIYLQDISGTGVDTGTSNVGAFQLDLTVSPGILADASFEPAGLSVQYGVWLNLPLIDLPQNKLKWYIAYNPGAVPFFQLDAPAPGDLIGYINVTALSGSAPTTLSFVANEAQTYIQDESGNVINRISNGLLIGDFQSIDIIESGSSVPTISSFSIDPAQIDLGSSAELSWSVADADTVTVDQSIGTVASAGSQNVSPTVTTTYTLSATNINGTSTAQVTLTVIQPGQPEITSFVVDPTSIELDESAVLTWTTQEADSVSISPAIPGAPGTLPLSGNITVSPNSTTTYTLSATNPQSTATAQATLTVVQPDQPVIDSFSVNPSSIGAGETTTLSWSTTHVDSVSLSPSFPGAPNPLPTSGSFEISPEETTTYTLSAQNTVNSVQRETTVIVAQEGKPVINSFYANPDDPEKGTQYNVSWDVDGGSSATTLTLQANNTVWEGITLLHDTRTYTANTAIAYTLTATNSVGTDVKSFNLNVKGVFEIVTFSVDKTEVFRGQEVTLSWFVSNSDQQFIDPAIGSISGEGAQTVVINQSVTFKLTAYRESEQKEATVTVNVFDMEEGEFLYFPLVRDDAEWFTEIGIVNLAPVTTIFDVYRFDQEGNAIEFFTNNRMAPFQSMKFVFDTQKEDAGWIKIRNKNLDIGSVGLFGWSNLRTHDGKQLVAYTAARVTDENLYVPHLAKDSSFYTLGAVVSGIGDGETYFNSSEQSFLVGNFVESQAATWDFRDLMSGDLGQDGWGRLAAESTLEQRISGLEIFGRTPQTGLSQALGITLDGETADELVFTHIAKDVNKFWTGCVVINPNATSVNLEIQLFNDEGQELDNGPAPEALPAGGKRTILVDKNQNGLASGTSWAVFKADKPIFGYMLFGSYAPDDFFSGFQSVKSPSKTLCFPDTEMSWGTNHSEGGWTGLALVNNNQVENQIRLVLINESGEEKGSVQMTLGPRKKFIGLVSSIFVAQTLEKGDKVMAFASQPIAGFELFGKNTETLGGILAFPWQYE